MHVTSPGTTGWLSATATMWALISIYSLAPAAEGWVLFDETAQPTTLVIGQVPGEIRSMIVDRQPAGAADEWRVRLENSLSNLKTGPAKIRFRGRADQSATTRIVLSQNHPPFQGLGLYQELGLTPEWKNFEFSFSVLADDPSARLHINLGAVTTKVEFADFALTLEGKEKSLEAPAMKPAIEPAPVQPEVSYPWRLSTQSGGKATMNLVGDPSRIRVVIDEPGSETWAVNVIFPTEPFQKGIKYKVAARLRGDKARVITLAASKNGPPFSSVGLYRQLELTPSAKDFEVEFEGSSTQDPSRIYFDLGAHHGNVEVESLSIEANGKKTSLFPAPGEIIAARPSKSSTPPVLATGPPQPISWEFATTGLGSRCQMVSAAPWSVQVRVDQAGKPADVVVKRSLQLAGIAPTMVIQSSVEGIVPYQIWHDGQMRLAEFAIPSPGEHRAALDLKGLPTHGEVEFRFLLGGREAEYKIGD
ncbi:carbohydrate binding domain-containing protein [bacterium]|nr:carbohydrate binding domain-containing protein [bacterium]